jgi:hypothetical protein
MDSAGQPKIMVAQKNANPVFLRSLHFDESLDKEIAY